MKATSVGRTAGQRAHMLDHRQRVGDEAIGEDDQAKQRKQREEAVEGDAGRDQPDIVVPRALVGPRGDVLPRPPRHLPRRARLVSLGVDLLSHVVRILAVASLSASAATMPAAVASSAAPAPSRPRLRSSDRPSVERAARPCRPSAGRRSAPARLAARAAQVRVLMRASGRWSVQAPRAARGSSDSGFSLPAPASLPSSCRPIGDMIGRPGAARRRAASRRDRRSCRAPSGARSRELNSAPNSRM